MAGSRRSPARTGDSGRFELRPHHSQVGIAWLALTALAMFALAWGKSRTGSALGNRVLQTEARITVIDGVLALAVLIGLVLNATLSWWWADPAAAFVIVYYGAREGRAALTEALRPLCSHKRSIRRLP